MREGRHHPMKMNWLKVVGAVVLIFFIVRGISALADGDVRGIWAIVIPLLVFAFLSRYRLVRRSERDE